MAGTEGSEAARWSKSQEACLSSDWSLKFDSMKLKSLVIAHQNGAVNTFPGLVHTARHTRKLSVPEVALTSAEGMGDDWGEVVTR